MKRGGDQDEVEQHLEQPPAVEDDASAASSRPARPRPRPRAALEVDEEAGELDEQRERDQDADERDPVVAEHAVGERGRAEAGGDRGEQDRPSSARTARRGRAGARCGPCRPGGSGAPRRIRIVVTSAVSRIGIASTRIGSSSVATVVSATFQLVASPSAPSVKPSTWLPESPMKTSAGLPGRKLKSRKPRQARPRREREDEQQPLLVDGDGVDREEGRPRSAPASRRARPCCRAG